jgi:hypothetical protein
MADREVELMTTPFDINETTYLSKLVVDGNIWDWITSPYSSLLGDFTYFFLIFIIIGMIYLKWQKPDLAFFIGGLFCAVFASAFPSSTYIYVGLGFSLVMCAALWQLFVARGA